MQLRAANAKTMSLGLNGRGINNLLPPLPDILAKSLRFSSYDFGWRSASHAAISSSFSSLAEAALGWMRPLAAAVPSSVQELVFSETCWEITMRPALKATGPSSIEPTGN